MGQTTRADAQSDTVDPGLVRDSLALLKAFRRIDDPKLRRRILVLVEKLSTDGDKNDLMSDPKQTTDERKG